MKKTTISRVSLGEFLFLFLSIFLKCFKFEKLLN